ncbi:neuronal pentraxin receptor [Latimeria chalumnae]|uniref:neuronal pentraxin receptor n=1 Tax=Latimeria chalumnae TaxID=7897 RepID=UPI00313DFEE3
MLAFLGAVICIIASVHPAASGLPRAAAAADNRSIAAPAAHSALQSAAHTSPGDLAGPGPGGPRPTAAFQPRFSRLVCAPLGSECPSAGPGPGDAALPGDEPWLLRSAAEQLRQTVRQQRDHILADQETIKELAGKLSRCENGLEQSFQGGGWGPGQHPMGDLPPADSHQAVTEMEEAVRSLKDRIEKMEELQARGNASLVGVTHSLLHSKARSLADELLPRILQLEQERAAILKANDQQGRVVETELTSLQNRISQLEKGETEKQLEESFKVLFPVRTNYMYARVRTTLPEMYAFTTCLWLKSKKSPGIGTPFSYSVPGQANEIVLLEWGQNPVELMINDKVAQLPLRIEGGTWHHICVTWTTRDGRWEAYQDGKRRGNGENLSAWHPIKPNGVIILGQEQDMLGGRFDAMQAFVGELAQMNVWDRILTPTEILGLANCSSVLTGNVLRWDEKGVEISGGATTWPFEKCKETNKEP